MCHFLLPSRGPGSDGKLDARYAEDAVALMLLGLHRFGAMAEEYQAKLFGGGNMFPHRYRAAEIGVGVKNGIAARNLMRDRGIPVVSESLFGNGHRKVIFEVKSGVVWSRQVQPADPSEVGGGR